MLNIWRERTTEFGDSVYDRVGTIELGICGSGVNASLVPGSDSVYECTLPESSRVSVQTGDIIGVDIESNNNMQFKVRYQQARVSNQISDTTYNQTHVSREWKEL